MIKLRNESTKALESLFPKVASIKDHVEKGRYPRIFLIASSVFSYDSFLKEWKLKSTLILNNHTIINNYTIITIILNNLFAIRYCYETAVPTKLVSLYFDNDLVVYRHFEVRK